MAPPFQFNVWTLFEDWKRYSIQESHGVSHIYHNRSGNARFITVGVRGGRRAVTKRLASRRAHRGPELGGTGDERVSACTARCTPLDVLLVLSRIRLRAV